MNVLMRGLDLSKWQGINVNFKSIKNSGYSFVIIRVNDWDSINHKSIKDARFEEYYKGATEAGLHVGCYWFTFANTLEYAKQEAEQWLKWTEGKRFDMPYYIDIERSEQFAQGKNFVTELAKIFCTTLEEAMKFIGIYCSTYYFNYIDKSLRDRQAIWVADYRDQCYYTGQYGMWQSCTVKCNGVNNGNTDVDYDECYVDYPTEIKKRGRNGYSKETYLDMTDCYKYGQNDVGILAIKTMINQLYNAKFCDCYIKNVTQLYDDELNIQANKIIKKWGYSPNGKIGVNFVKKLCESVRGFK